ncbi:MAG: hypothetical protein JNK72_23940 [Myxococcales bacterium]|nr:hypothetical protein [Myxococcales bacterium]
MKKSNTLRYVAGFMAWVLLQGCTARYLPAPVAPPRQVVETPVEVSPGPNEGVVVIDAEGGPAQVEWVTERSMVTGNGRAFNAGSRPAVPVGNQVVYGRPLCVTPCAVALPRGPRELRFSGQEPESNRQGFGWVTVGAETTYVRHAPGFRDSREGSFLVALLMSSVGAMGLLMGGVLAAVGETTTDRGEPVDFRPAGLVTLGVGGLLTTVGITLGVLRRPVVQPGSTTTWRAQSVERPAQ